MKQNISRLKKKTGPSQIRTQDLCRPRHIRYLQAKTAGNAKKIEYIMKQGRDESKRPVESFGQSCLWGKSLVPGCNTLAYRKGNQIVPEHDNIEKNILHVENSLLIETLNFLVSLE